MRASNLCTTPIGSMAQYAADVRRPMQPQHFGLLPESGIR